MSAQTLDKVSGLVALNSLMAMAGRTLAALFAGAQRPWFRAHGPLAGLWVCAGSDVMHPVAALVVGAAAGVIFVYLFTLTRTAGRSTIVLGYGRCTACAAPGVESSGNLRLQGARRLGGVALVRSWRAPRLGIAGWRLPGCDRLWGLKAVMGLRLEQEDEYNGADISIHNISATPEKQPVL